MENRGMKWHKFLIYFSLWFGAVVNTLFGGGMLLMILTDPPYKYRGETGLLLMFALLSAGILLCGVWSVVIRFKLAKFKQGAPAQLFALIILVNVLSGLFLLLDEGVALTSVVPGIVMAFVNRYYYSKRADLFVE